MNDKPASHEARSQSAYQLLKLGGAWLGAARSWIQWHCRNGSEVDWGTRAVLAPPLTVQDVEEIAAEAVAAFIAAQRTSSPEIASDTGSVGAFQARSLSDTEVARLEKLLSEVRPDGGWIFGDDGTVGRSFGKVDTWCLTEQEAEFLTSLADAAPALLARERAANAAPSSSEIAGETDDPGAAAPRSSTDTGEAK